MRRNSFMFVTFFSMFLATTTMSDDASGWEESAKIDRIFKSQRSEIETLPGQNAGRGIRLQIAINQLRVSDVVAQKNVHDVLALNT